eukprot:gb/GECH01013029.1/.p1 GENE.gb/GECH01013029.1/~~gb/GECH01013029.1/.p1  ORF type:complete len:288 (+),score=93.16 gb/GECH01013029.1/:1-864(+)
MEESEVKRRLRLRDQPITYFGESTEERLERLKFLEEKQPINYEEKQKSREALIEEKSKNIEEDISDKAEIEQKKSEMSPNQQRLFDLKMKLNACRKENLDEMVRERKREQNNGKSQYIRGKKRKAKDIESGDNKDQDGYVLTAAQAEEMEQAKKRKKDRAAPHGWEVFNDDAIFKAYGKRVDRVPITKKEYEQQKEKLGDEFYPTVDSLNFGSSAYSVPHKNVNRMVNELKETEERRSKFSRRRPYNDDEYVDYINDRNKVFNKKISRAFDDYTTEIKENLERGTAL